MAMWFLLCKVPMLMPMPMSMSRLPNGTITDKSLS